jgi:protein FRG1
MSDAYSIAKTGGGLKLKLKGEGSSKDKPKKSKKRKSESEKSSSDLKHQDEVNHGGGWLCENFDQITGSVFIELQEYMYMHGLENGLFVIGAPHDPTERPSMEEVLTAIRADENHIALKSAHGQYLSVNQNGLIVARSEAISPKEYFEVLIDYDYDGRKIYLKASNDKYVGVNHEGDIVTISDKKDGLDLRIRSLNKRDKLKEAKRDLPEEERVDDLANVELNYVKKFQKFQDKKIRLYKGDDDDLKSAKERGELHEKLLDRREKMKADRYCK